MALFNRRKQQYTRDALPQTGQEQMPQAQSSPSPGQLPRQGLFGGLFGSQRAPETYAQGDNSSAAFAGQDIGGASGVTDGFKALAEVIGREQIHEANQVLQKYKQGKKNLDRRIVENEQWYKLRHWECMREKHDGEEPASAWLFNCISNKHADAMDNFPSPNILPREEGDRAEAEKLSSIIPVILDQGDFEQVYSDVMHYKLKTGTGVYGVFWDNSKLNGLGDISIRQVDILNLFWEPGIKDIQSSRNLFHVELCDNDVLIGSYPQLARKLGGSNMDIAKYVYDDAVDTTDKSVVVDWYYKKTVRGKTLLHYVKYVNDEVLFATENDPNFSERGWYDHGMYPFVFDVLFPTAGTPTGFGYIDIGKEPQAYIDRGNQAIMENMRVNAKPRFFINADGGVNEEEFTDLSKSLIHVDGNLGKDSIIPATGTGLSSIYVQVLNNKIDELKETTGNRDVSNGGTSGGVTAASAIAAMQEAGGKLSRDHNKASYRAFRKLCVMIIELIRQFYDTTRCFRIMGENGAARYVQYNNSAIQPQSQGYDFGNDMGFRLPQFDIEVTAQKQSPYSKMAQNELALQFYQAGFFNPQMADQALMCLDMMDFDRKQFIIQKIAQQGTLHQKLIQYMQMALSMAQQFDPAMAQQIYADLVSTSGGMPQGGGMSAEAAVSAEAIGGNGGESANTKKARQRSAETASPR